ncbi:MAG: acetyl-CoA carboxylase carboxyltransferase subunit alpha [Lachnospiraceae bacterium]|nr:acetyl-CoA carboxylase carboxyltransferase subunit alpha [Lachnospiraceae bacterium]
MRQKKLTPYERLEIARDINRPKVTDYIDALFEDFIELSGDRLGKEDASILGGIAFFEGMPVTVIGHRKGSNLEENIKYNFGMPGPEGYRKALRLMKQAEKFHRPVITFVDTPGAYPGKEAEENGQSIAIAENLAEMSALKVPIITIVTGEGNSGGALAISVADKIWMLENAVYSVLSPEGFASILWKDAKRSKEACEVMKMTAEELYAGGLCDQVIPEAEGGIQEDFSGGCSQLRKALRTSLPGLMKTNAEILLENRYQKYRHIEGEYHAIRKKA